MNQIAPFNQNFVNNLPGVNNTGVCFSLCIEWLLNPRSVADYVDNVRARAQTIYAAGSHDPLNQIQSAANSLAVGTLDPETVVAAAQALFPQIRGVQHVPGGNLPTNTLPQTPFPTNLVWLREPNGRGHVVAYDTGAPGYYFDSNLGLYSAVPQGGGMTTQAAGMIGNNYNPPQFNAFGIYSLDIR